MPATGLLALLDDIATMSKVAATKTAGISGDDLAVNSKALVGIDPKRELPIVYEVAKGSLKNKGILIPGALVLSAVAPWAIMPLLTLGGAYLCYEGIEKILHKEEHGGQQKQAPVDMAALEQKKVKSAIKTDLILSAEIVAVTLGAVAASPFITQVAVLSAVGLAMTVGIYGLVGGIVKLDDVGLWLSKKEGNSPFAKARRAFGRGLVAGVPHMMKGISVAGTAAMFMVGGGLVLHGLPFAHGMMETVGHLVSSPALQTTLEMTAATLSGAAVGLVAVPVMKLVENITEKAAPVMAKIKSFAQKAKAAVFKKKSIAAKTADATPLPEGTRAEKTPAEKPVALTNMPDVKAAHEAAAQKTAADNGTAAVTTEETAPQAASRKNGAGPRP